MKNIEEELKELPERGELEVIDDFNNLKATAIVLGTSVFLPRTLALEVYRILIKYKRSTREMREIQEWLEKKPH